ncbi:hypothetical protein PVBG_05183 [Plasmodium vivax Brazil I]|uniref:Uncharacterized protein n=1 Tax=Plasmodium vivax (strain Brazil I) TaxID=1033975 RepID=A0A0J9VAT0_PLAV1|nr:hypothetical protein PVBG_05183 [Plasmodium vivax Brazil I]
MNFIKYYKHFSYREHHYYKLKIYTALSFFFKLIYMENHYPFLKDVWDTIDEFDESVENDQNNHRYFFVCNKIIDLSKGEQENHKDVCMKLVRNLGHHTNNNKFLSHTADHCNNLNNWIYYSMKKHKIPEKIITECFEEYNFHMRSIKEEPRCSYYAYDHTYFEPMKIVELKIFHDNMNIITNTYIQEYERYKVPLQKYICEYVNIYKDLNSTHCPYELRNTENNKETCNMLNNFKTTYMSYFYNYVDKKDDIPSLYDVENEYKKKCIPPELVVPSDAPRDSDVRALSSFSEDDGERRNEFSPPLLHNGETPGSSMSRFVSTAVGTMAGASSILALLYKVTQNFI